MRNLYQNFPQSPGVYLMKNREGEIIYVGKAGNLKKRVSSYFLLVHRSLGVGGRANDLKTEKLVQEIVKIDYKKTDTVIEALILEAELIKKFAPRYNVKDKDNKSFLYVEITKEEFPRVILMRGKDITRLSQSQVNVKKEKLKTYFGPYTSSSSIRQALKIIRKIFPYSLHKFGSSKFGNRIFRFEDVGNFSPEMRFQGKQQKRACFDYEIGLCPGVCAGLISRKDYLKNIKNIKLFFKGQKGRILKNLEKEMKGLSKQQEFEKAVKLRGQIFALKHIQDSALIKDNSKMFSSFKFQVSSSRIEGYDISSISGTSAAGSMVVFTDGKPDKNEYRKFKIKTIFQSDDTGMLREVLNRRFSRRKNDWKMPDLILIDGGKPQINAVKKVLNELGFKIPVAGIAKGSKRKKNEFIGIVPKFTNENTLIKIRDEAHRFAISFHKKLREKEFLSVL